MWKYVWAIQTSLKWEVYTKAFALEQFFIEIGFAKSLWDRRPTGK